MRPQRMTPAHKTDLLAELVCSNSFKYKSPTSPAGQLKAEMVALGSLVIPTGEENSVPGGEALAVDRDLFARAITEKVDQHPLIEVVRRPFLADDISECLKDGPIILATGPLTSPDLSEYLANIAGREHLYFYDAVSPTVDASTLDRNIVFAQSRYDKGGDDYLNCPFDKQSYLAFVEALRTAERAAIHGFEAEDHSLLETSSRWAWKTLAQVDVPMLLCNSDQRIEKRHCTPWSLAKPGSNGVSKSVSSRWCQA